MMSYPPWVAQDPHPTTELQQGTMWKWAPTFLTVSDVSWLSVCCICCWPALFGMTTSPQIQNVLSYSLWCPPWFRLLLLLHTKGITVSWWVLLLHPTVLHVPTVYEYSCYYYCYIPKGITVSWWVFLLHPTVLHVPDRTVIYHII